MPERVVRTLLAEGAQDGSVRTTGRFGRTFLSDEDFENSSWSSMVKSQNIQNHNGVGTIQLSAKYPDRRIVRRVVNAQRRDVLSVALLGLSNLR